MFVDLPLVSIGLPVYNGARFLRGALESLLGQDYPALEVIISDNASEDATPEICMEYAKRDSRIRYYRAEQNRGATWNFNRVFALARGEFFMWAAHDDLWHPTCIRGCVEKLLDEPEAALCHSASQPITPNGRPVGNPFLGIDYRNEEPKIKDRWRRSITSHVLYVSIYGLMRRSMAAKTRLLGAYNGSDFVFVSELSLHGKILHTAGSLASKRMPESMADYHTHDEMLEYLSGPGKKRAWMIYSRAYLELLRGLRYANISPRVNRELATDLFKAYFSCRIWLLDFKATVVRLLNRARYNKRPRAFLQKANL